MLDIDVELVSELIATQFPKWAELPVAPVLPGGWDNRTFRLGDELLVRLPSAEGYAVQVDKEHRWLPMLAANLAIPIPTPVERGVPGKGYPFPWSVYGWLAGDSALNGVVDDLGRLAVELAEFLLALQQVNPHGGPGPGLHSQYRGGPLQRWDAETRGAVTIVSDLVDPVPAIERWEQALEAPFEGAAVWFHGDFAAGNLLIHHGRLVAVIDFGCAGVGDPACDLSIAWTMLHGNGRQRFRDTLGPDPSSWSRGRGWALWKALITLRDVRDKIPAVASESLRVITEIINDASEG